MSLFLPVLFVPAEGFLLSSSWPTKTSAKAGVPQAAQSFGEPLI